MAEETSKKLKTEKIGEHKFSQKQYDMLKRCSDKKNITKWNDWRKEHPDEDILLENNNFDQWCLKGVYLNKGKFKVGAKTHNFTGEVHLKDATFRGSGLQQAKFHIARLQGANLEGAKLQDAILWEAKLQKANLRETYLQDAKLNRADLRGAEFGGAKLQNADFSRAIVDGGTLIWRCKVNQKTKFEGVVLDAMRIYPATRQLLEYNVRRMNWEDWYKEHPKLKWPIKLFWWMSNYGLSTGKIIFTFFSLAIIFANIYYHWGRIFPPGIVGNLFIDRSGAVIPWQLVPLRTLYFSIVTMTTLGFGDMYAYPTSWFGHILLMVQVILGYVLLGALITRFAVLFTAGGPAGKFADE